MAGKWKHPTLDSSNIVCSGHNELWYINARPKDTEPPTSYSIERSATIKTDAQFYVTSYNDINIKNLFYLH